MPAAVDAIVDVEWIAARLEDPGVRLVEVDVSRVDYDQGHIPGAVLWNAYADLRDGDYKPVEQMELGRLFSRSGIDPETTVVTYGYAARGERFWPSGATEETGRSGRIPGAAHVPIDALRADAGTLKSAGELRSVFEQAGVTEDKPTIVYCTIGNRASEAWFALSYVLGYPNVRVYYGSWVEWGRAIDTPVDSEV